MVCYIAVKKYIMKHIEYSKEAVDLIISRMPDEFYRQFVRLYFGAEYTLQEVADHFNYSKRHMERINSKVRKMIEAMGDIVNGDIKENPKQMTHIEVLILFVDLFHIKDEIQEWWPNGQNSVRVRLKADALLPFNTAQKDLVFTAKVRENWRLETVDSFLESIGG